MTTFTIEDLFFQVLCQLPSQKKPGRYLLGICPSESAIIFLQKEATVYKASFDTIAGAELTPSQDLMFALVYRSYGQLKKKIDCVVETKKDRDSIVKVLQAVEKGEAKAAGGEYGYPKSPVRLHGTVKKKGRLTYSDRYLVLIPGLLLVFRSKVTEGKKIPYPLNAVFLIKNEVLAVDKQQLILKSPSRTWEFQFASAVSRNEWCTILKDAIQRATNRPSAISNLSDEDSGPARKFQNVSKGLIAGDIGAGSPQSELSRLSSLSSAVAPLSPPMHRAATLSVGSSASNLLDLERQGPRDSSGSKPPPPSAPAPPIPGSSGRPAVVSRYTKTSSLPGPPPEDGPPPPPPPGGAVITLPTGAVVTVPPPPPDSPDAHHHAEPRAFFPHSMLVPPPPPPDDRSDNVPHRLTQARSIDRQSQPPQLQQMQSQLADEEEQEEHQSEEAHPVEARALSSASSICCEKEKSVII